MKTWLLTPVLLGLGVAGPSAGFADNTRPEFSSPSTFRFDADVMAQPRAMILADNHGAGEQTDKTGISSDDKTQQKTATNNEKKTLKDKNETKGLKSFEPTEKVKADQAVDFPYDI